MSTKINLLKVLRTLWNEVFLKNCQQLKVSKYFCKKTISSWMCDMIFTSLHKIIYKVFGIHKVFASQMIRRLGVYFFNPDDVFKFIFIICSPNIERAFFQRNPKRHKQQPLNCGKCYQRLKLTVILERNFLKKYIQ